MLKQNEFVRYATGHLGLSHALLERVGGQTAAAARQLRGFSPAIIEERPMHMVQLDVFSRLMMDRIIFLGVPIDDYVANVIQAQLLFLDSVDPKREISLYINSPGGAVIAGLGIYDTMQFIRPEVHTICTSMAASMGAVLLASGTKGKRSCLPHSRIMIHQTSGGAQGQLTDMEITYKLFKSLQSELYEILSKHTGQPLENINRDCDRDHWMKADEALQYGLVDEVLEKA